MKRFAIFIILAALTCASADAQSLLNQLGNREYEPVDPYTVTGRPLHSIPLGLP
jgi:hypothetical protein